MKLFELCSKKGGGSGESGEEFDLIEGSIKVDETLLEVLSRALHDISKAGLPQILVDVLGILKCLVIDIVSLVKGLVTCVVTGHPSGEIKFCMCAETCGCVSSDPSKAQPGGSGENKDSRCNKENIKCAEDKTKALVELWNDATEGVLSCEEDLLLKSIPNAYLQQCRVSYRVLQSNSYTENIFL